MECANRWRADLERIPAARLRALSCLRGVGVRVSLGALYPRLQAFWEQGQADRRDRLVQGLALGYCISGRMKVFMDDGSEGECGPGDVVAIPPGHDAEVVGDEPCVFIDFGEFGDYAKRG
jgi:hypothetical protein